MKDKDRFFDEPIKLDAYALRTLAETASGRRRPKGNPFFLHQSGDQLVLHNGDAGEIPPAGTLIAVDTHDHQPLRPQVSNVIIEAEGQVRELAHKFDSVFWTEAAVEKFVFPYLVSRSLWKAANHLKALSDCWYHGCPIPTADGTGEEVVIPFAIGHTPDSDFNLEEGKDLQFLFLRKDGTVHALPLAELIREREAEGHGTADPAPRTPASPDGA
jgi:hypothetical protein